MNYKWFYNVSFFVLDHLVIFARNKGDNLMINIRSTAST